jgi:hypothetical protein
MRLRKSQIVLVVASLATLWLTWKTYENAEPIATVLPTRVVSASREKIPVIAESEQIDLAPQRRPLIALTGDLFSPQKIKLTKSIHAHTLPPPKAVAPPLPFKYMGRWQDSDKRTVLIDYQGEVIAIKEGDIIANQYKVVAINELSGSDSPGIIQIQFLMMPLNQIQTMQVGGANHE